MDQVKFFKGCLPQILLGDRERKKNMTGDVKSHEVYKKVRQVARKIILETCNCE